MQETGKFSRPDLANKDVWNLIAALLTALCSLAIAIAFFLLGTTLLDMITALWA